METFLEIFNKINQKSKNLEKLSTEIISMEKNGQMSMKAAEGIISDSFKTLSSIHGDLKTASEYLPEQEDIYKKVKAEPSLSVAYENGVYHFILDELLPHRTYYPLGRAYRDRYVRYDYDTSLIYNGYRAGVEEYKKANNITSNDIPLCRGHVFVLFISHFADRNLVDPDNQDIKPFIDSCIQGFLTLDDGPEYVTICIKGDKKGDKPYTEVYAGDMKKIMRKIENAD